MRRRSQRVAERIEASIRTRPHKVISFHTVAWCAAALLNLLALLSPTRSEEQSSPANLCVTPNTSQVRVPGGTFRMGSQTFSRNDVVARNVTVATFWIDRFDVTNEQFAKFVAATGYVTDAERNPDSGDYPDVEPDDLVPGAAVFTKTQGWQFVANASWRHPLGPDSSIVGREHLPVVQVSYNDALEYAKWRGHELPTEEQYEYAARGGLAESSYAWGNELTSQGKWLANVWQGAFPRENTAEDGYRGVAPVGCFPPNGYGLYDMTGNVWKWTSTLYAQQENSRTRASRDRRIIKGGSFMCSPSLCHGFRPSSRQLQESDFASMHLGFRTMSNRPPAP